MGNDICKQKGHRLDGNASSESYIKTKECDSELVKIDKLEDIFKKMLECKNGKLFGLILQFSKISKNTSIMLSDVPGYCETCFSFQKTGKLNSHISNSKKKKCIVTRFIMCEVLYGYLYPDHSKLILCANLHDHFESTVFYADLLLREKCSESLGKAYNIFISLLPEYNRIIKARNGKSFYLNIKSRIAMLMVELFDDEKNLNKALKFMMDSKSLDDIDTFSRAYMAIHNLDKRSKNFDKEKSKKILSDILHWKTTLYLMTPTRIRIILYKVNQGIPVYSPFLLPPPVYKEQTTLKTPIIDYETVDNQVVERKHDDILDGLNLSWENSMVNEIVDEMSDTFKEDEPLLRNRRKEEKNNKIQPKKD